MSKQKIKRFEGLHNPSPMEFEMVSSTVLGFISDRLQIRNLEFTNEGVEWIKGKINNKLIELLNSKEFTIAEFQMGL